MLTDEALPFYSPFRKPDPPKRKRPGERLWTLTKGGQRRYAELRDNGEFGFEFQLFADTDTFLYGKRFDTRAAALPLSNEERDERLRAGWTLIEAQ
ncbi:MAG: hypothetical protein ABL962_15020 [Fimbriimonadaceae bacterium]